mmetsp:Transcript_19480/g.56811  ORF Transcript_19480/g.56811 Transcript_19480/m.56811 type:complete len:227 (+) Transcript_19480:2210-2890(+)
MQELPLFLSTADPTSLRAIQVIHPHIVPEGRSLCETARGSELRAVDVRQSGIGVDELLLAKPVLAVVDRLLIVLDVDGPIHILDLERCWLVHAEDIRRSATKQDGSSRVQDQRVAKPLPRTVRRRTRVFLLCTPYAAPRRRGLPSTGPLLPRRGGWNVANTSPKARATGRRSLVERKRAWQHGPTSTSSSPQPAARAALLPVLGSRGLLWCSCAEATPWMEQVRHA